MGGLNLETEKRRRDIGRFYELLDRLRERVGGVRRLRDTARGQAWPQRGVYFFFEDGEMRTESGTGPRLVRIGTHALKAGSKTTLWNRLSQHRGGLKSGGGNHRGSVFRLHVGGALMARDSTLVCPTWARGSSADAETKSGEVKLECAVSACIGAMPFLWIDIDDAPGAESARGVIERNAIGLLSNFGRAPVDAPSPGWLGHHCRSERVRSSGLWNSNHVDEGYTADFLDLFARYIARMDAP